MNADYLIAPRTARVLIVREGIALAHAPGSEVRKGDQATLRDGSNGSVVHIKDF